jgi:hypothetical protein
MDDGVVAADQGEGVAGVREIGLHVVGRSRRRSLEARGMAVADREAVPGGVKGVDGGGADLAAPAGYEDAHAGSLAEPAARRRGAAAGKRVRAPGRRHIRGDPVLRYRSSYATLAAQHPGKATITGVYRVNASYVRFENLTFSGEVQLAGGSDHIDISNQAVCTNVSCAAGAPSAWWSTRRHATS